MTRADAQIAAQTILSRYQPHHVARLFALSSGPLLHSDIDGELGPITLIDGRVKQRGLVHSYGGGLSPAVSALTPLGRAVVEMSRAIESAS